MRLSILKLFLVFTLAIMIGAPACWAKEKAFCYVIAYSYRDKLAFYTPIFTQKVDGTSYSKDEYVSDTDLIQKMEGAFQDHVEKVLRMNTRDFTFSARGAYKTHEIAKIKQDKETGDFRFKGFELKEVPDFNLE